MKNLIKTVLISTLATTMLFTGCTKTSSINDKKVAVNDNDKINIVASTYVGYDWVNEIIKGHEDKFNVSLLMDSGVDIHNFQPTAEDLVNVKASDLFIYVGGESDEWAEDVVTDDMLTVNMLETVGEFAKEEVAVEGMEDTEEEEAEEGEVEYDEHVWLSLKNAKLIVSAIEKDIASINSANASDYEANLTEYISKLDELDDEFTNVVSNKKIDTVVVADRFPFAYLFGDYNIKYYAAFKGCSAETEASFETIAFLANKVDELGLNYVVTLENSDGKIANAVIENTANKTQTILTLNSLQTISDKSYIDVMENNIDVLTEVLEATK